jgi:hypothetical protein
MPKEIINSKYAGSSDSPEPIVHVGWSKEQGHVELSVISTNDKQGLYEVIDGEVTPLNILHNGWFAQLDRYGLNRLIRTLKKAGKDAFGTDEW